MKRHTLPKARVVLVLMVYHTLLLLVLKPSAHQTILLSFFNDTRTHSLLASSLLVLYMRLTFAKERQFH